MTDVNPDVAIVIIGAIQAITLALLGIVGKWLTTIKASSTAVRKQVENSHTSNLRDDMDEKHEKLIKRISGLDIRTSKHIELLSERVNGIDDRFNGIESRLDIVAQLIINTDKRNGQ